MDIHIYIHIYLYIHIYSYTPQRALAVQKRMKTLKKLCRARAEARWVQWREQAQLKVRLSFVDILDGYCSTVQGLLDWFEVDLGFTRAFIYSNRFVWRGAAQGAHLHSSSFSLPFLLSIISPPSICVCLSLFLSPWCKRRISSRIYAHIHVNICKYIQLYSYIIQLYSFADDIHMNTIVCICRCLRVCVHIFESWCVSSLPLFFLRFLFYLSLSLSQSISSSLFVSQQREQTHHTTYLVFRMRERENISHITYIERERERERTYLVFSLFSLILSPSLSLSLSLSLFRYLNNASRRITEREQGQNAIY